MSRQLFIITGTSRGLGAAMADQLLVRGNSLLCLARNANAALAGKAQQLGLICAQWTVDLAQTSAVSARLQASLQDFDTRDLGSASLINNAGVLARIGPVDQCPDEALAQALRVSLEAPMLLTAAFLRATRDWSASRRVLNVSSGLGRRAMAGSAGYCAAKAGMDHFSRAVALDEAQHERGARIVSLAPGVIDTDMQVQLRSADMSGFPDRGNFEKLKADGLLSSTEDAAARLLRYLDRSDFGNQAVADIRDA